MAKIEARATLHVEVPFTLNESEAAALEALAGYGTDAFLKVFYKQMGEAYLRPHEAGLRSLFEGARTHMPDILERARRARDTFAGRDIVRRNQRRDPVAEGQVTASPEVPAGSLVMPVTVEQGVDAPASHRGPPPPPPVSLG
ncbi:hypothetical protein SAMN02982917_2348 [Azospirillum oryzae]|uniref:Uncharacterized protein n=1 Tax=Azospirillum oryzae TaxID=286727 RepID=A0A1X7F962_9PROT|nr:hypothetical protein [Azospirillum oryzae]SMF47906.1 hypothetical protein SAMN02982917_2348 [Azospirillum oryzae]